MDFARNELSAIIGANGRSKFKFRNMDFIFAAVLLRRFSDRNCPDVVCGVMCFFERAVARLLVVSDCFLGFNLNAIEFL